MRLFFFILIAASIFTTCKSTKTLGGNTSILKKSDEKEVVKVLEQNHFAPKYIVAKAKVKYRDEVQNVNFNLQIRMVRDQQIWLSATFLGMEVARLLINQDSIWAMNKFERTYSVKSFEEIQKEYGNEALNYRMVQNLLLGNDLLWDVKPSHFEVGQDGYFLTKKYRHFLQKMHLTHHPLEVASIELTDLESEYILAEVALADYKKLRNKNIAFYREYNIRKMDHENAFIQIDINQMEEKNPGNMPFEIPSRYSSMD